MLCDVLTGCQTLNQAAVEFPPGGIVDIPDVCIWLVESGITDQTLQAVTFTVAVRGALKYAVSPNDVSALLLS